MIDSEFNSTLTHPTEYFFHVKIIDFPTSLGLDNGSERFSLNRDLYFTDTVSENISTLPR